MDTSETLANGSATMPAEPSKPHVLIIGAGFAGLTAAKKLASLKDCQITLVDKNNYHLFQPLLYQVATGGLSAGDIAAPVRSLFRRRKNVFLRQDSVVEFIPDARELVMQSGVRLRYDFLILATGLTQNYFGNSEWRQFAPALKTVEDSLEMRRRILSSFELAELELDEQRRRELLTFVVVGGGPTGVELSGAIAELARHTLRDEFRRAEPSEARIVLIEGGERLLEAFPEELSRKAVSELRQLGVEVRLRALATHIDAAGVEFSAGAHTERIAAHTVLWAAGVTGTDAGKMLAEATGTELNREGRLKTLPDLSLESYPEIMVAGDLAYLVDENGTLVPALAPAAIQQGRYVARRIRAHLRGKKSRPFRYRDKGNLAVIGRSSAVADIGRLHFSGLSAWFIWALVHIYFLIDFGNKLLVSVQWCWSYLTKKRGSRLIVAVASSNAKPEKEASLRINE